MTTQTSGDLTADRRAEYARHYAQANDFAAAADLIEQALDLAPGHLPFLSLQGEWLAKAGRTAEAAAVWAPMLRLDAQDRFGAQLKLASIGLTETPDAPPPAYVESLFDDFAPRFDTSLVEKLDYHAPLRLADAIVAALGDAKAIRHAVDLGCGTGLMGERLRGRASFLEGIDLSAGMLKRARGKGIYDRLEKGDVTSPAFAETEPGRADLAVAADVYIYLGDLAAAFGLAAQLLETNGLYAFTVEAHDGPEDYAVRPSLRYAHSQAYLGRALADAGFETVRLDRIFLRKDGAANIEGFLVVARKAGSVTVLPEAIAAEVEETAGTKPGEGATRH